LHVGYLSEKKGRVVERCGPFETMIAQG
jgi:hypothetical protein